MARKPLPIEVIVTIYHQLANLSAKHPDRQKIIQETAEVFNVSLSIIRRAIKNYQQPHAIRRSDYNKPRNISIDEMLCYCELFAALKIRSTNRKGKQLSTPRAIEILENHGVEVEGKLIIPSKGLLTKPTVNRYLKRLGLTSKNFLCAPVVVRFQATYSNECWQLDFTPSELKRLSDNSTKENHSLILASVVDDRSGMMYQEYHLSEGENVLMALRFLFNAMSQKVQNHLPFQGIPLMIYLDNGPVFKSLVFQRVCKQLGIELRTHMPAGSDGRRITARSKGKVERAFNTVQNKYIVFGLELGPLWIGLMAEQLVYGAIVLRKQYHLDIPFYEAFLMNLGFEKDKLASILCDRELVNINLSQVSMLSRKTNTTYDLVVVKVPKMSYDEPHAGNTLIEFQPYDSSFWLLSYG